MKNFKNYVHTFSINGNEIALSISYTDGLWECDIIKGKTGMGKSSGGKYESLQKYIFEMEREHRYCYNFFKFGYKYAKENV